MRIYLRSGDYDSRLAFFECPVCGHIDVASLYLTYGCECEYDDPTVQPWNTPRIRAAYAAARSERFGT